MTKPTTFSRALDDVGSAIGREELLPGSAVTVQQLIERTGASRSIVREVTQVLGAAGMVEARQRVGIRILASDRWNPLDPNVVRWQLQSAGRESKIRELFELRLAVEPAAAGLAATRRSDDDADRISLSARGLADAAAAHDGTAFARHDSEFHRAVLTASGNPSFVYLSGVIETALIDRDLNLTGDFDHAAIELHAEVARHIAGRESALAAGAMTRIVTVAANGSVQPL